MADPTADLRQQLADHEAGKDKRDTKCFSNLGDCRGLSKEARRWNSRNQGSSQVTVWQWLTRAHRGKLTSRPRIQKQTKQEDTKILATIQNFRRRQERYRPKQTQPTLQGPSSTTKWVWLSITGCGCGFVRMRIKTIQTSNKNFILKYFRCRDGKRTETRIGMEGICITHSCIPPL